MNFWYGIIRNQFGKIRFKKVSEIDALTQFDFLKLLEYDPKNGDVVVELDFGNHMEHSQFVSYVSLYFKSNIRVKRLDVIA